MAEGEGEGDDDPRLEQLNAHMYSQVSVALEDKTRGTEKTKTCDL